MYQTMYLIKFGNLLELMIKKAYETTYDRLKSYLMKQVGKSKMVFYKMKRVRSSSLKFYLTARGLNGSLEHSLIT